MERAKSNKAGEGKNVAPSVRVGVGVIDLTYIVVLIPTETKLIYTPFNQRVIDYCPRFYGVLGKHGEESLLDGPLRVGTKRSVYNRISVGEPVVGW